jgi:hypothetical protein
MTGELSHGVGADRSHSQQHAQVVNMSLLANIRSQHIQEQGASGAFQVERNGALLQRSTKLQSPQQRASTSMFSQMKAPRRAANSSPAVIHTTSTAASVENLCFHYTIFAADMYRFPRYVSDPRPAESLTPPGWRHTYGAYISPADMVYSTVLHIWSNQVDGNQVDGASAGRTR